MGPSLLNRYREQLPAIVHKLMELGGNFVATSASYDGTEEILGRAIKGRRREVYIFTASGASGAQRVLADCERSLKRFQTDVIDGYFSMAAGTTASTRRLGSSANRARSVSSA